MNQKEVIIPTKDEVITLLTIAKDDYTMQLQSVGELLEMKLADSFIPKINGTPEWGFEGLSIFFNDYAIDDSFSIEEALERLNADKS